jgi:hypothetical protein
MAVVRSVGRWAGMKAARRLSRTVPFAGTLIAVALAGQAVRRKGLVRGLLDTGLDALPFLGAMKAGVELITGDLIGERPTRVAAAPTVEQASRAKGPRRRLRRSA